MSIQRRDRPSRALAVLPILLLALGAVSCWEGPGVDSIRRAVERQVPEARYEQDVHLRLGRLTTGFARWITNMALDEEEDAEALTLVNSVRRVEVAVFLNRSTLSEDHYDRVTLPGSLRRMLARDGWSVMAESREAGSLAWVLVNRDVRRGKPSIRGLYVVSLEPEELAVVRLEGHFDEAFARVFADHPHEAPDRVLEDAEG
ncbi:MAG: DUF4252 domain-containing protein [Acidobacteriota bacterium]|jgi:hypothetical protein